MLSVFARGGVAARATIGMEKDESADGNSEEGVEVVRAELWAYCEREWKEPSDPADREERGDDALAIDGRDWRSDVSVATAFLSTSAASSADSFRFPLPLFALVREASSFLLRD